MQCRECGAPLIPGERFCGNCGTPVTSVCPSCGAPVEPSERFCGNCGQPLGAATTAPSPVARPAPEPQPVPQRRRGFPVKAVILPLVLVALVAAGLVAWANGAFNGKPLTVKATPPPTATRPLPSPTAPVRAAAPVTQPTATPSPVPATAPQGTSTRPPTPTLPPTATPKAPATSTQALQQVLYRDDFSDPQSGFATSSADPATYLVGYRDKEYELTLLTAPGDLQSSSWCGSVQNQQTFNDFALEIGARLLEAAENGSYAVLFRFQDFDNYYKFMVDPNVGKYKLYKLVGNRETILVDWASAEAIKHGTATNKLQVVAKGPTISILVNGTPLKSVEDAAFNQGRVGMMINAWYEPISARFDNLVVKPPE